jgi:hypothetical protein
MSNFCTHTALRDTRGLSREFIRELDLKLSTPSVFRL